MPKGPQGQKRPAAVVLLQFVIATLIAPPSVSLSSALASPPLTAAANLNSVDQLRLDQLITQHRQARARLPPEQVADLDRISHSIRSRLFSQPLWGNLLEAATRIVNGMIPGLSPSESETIAEYALSEIASEGAAMGSGAGGMGTGANAGGIGGGSDAIGAATGGDSQSQLFSATKQMQETQMSFNLQYLQLQSQMQDENRSYTAVSNIMKTKHDTVKNSISNVR
jgi:hypothetical protein